MKKTIIWRVSLGDENYSNSPCFLLSGENAATVEAKAIRLAKAADRELVAGEAKHAPYVRSIELMGELNDAVGTKTERAG